MGVEHTISTGIGYVVELPEGIVGDEYDGDDYAYIEEVLSEFDQVEYIVGGSYYESRPVQFAIVARHTGDSIEDAAGIYNTASIIGFMENHEDRLDQLRAAYEAITGAPPVGDPEFLIAGLWH